MGLGVSCARQIHSPLFLCLGVSSQRGISPWISAIMIHAQSGAGVCHCQAKFIFQTWSQFGMGALHSGMRGAAVNVHVLEGKFA